MSAQAKHAAYLQTTEWLERRNAAIARAGGRCQLCNSDRYLNVHHRSYERLGRERDSDLTVLCRRCHERFHGITQPHAAAVRRAPKPAPERIVLIDPRLDLDDPIRRVRGIARRWRGTITVKQIRARRYEGLTRRQIRAALDVLTVQGALYEVSPGRWIWRHKGQ